MKIKVGTFNLNNLFSRWNFRAEVEEVMSGNNSIAIASDLVLVEPDAFEVRSFMGRLVRKKDPVDCQRIVERILEIDVDVLAVQEVEDLDTLKRFAIDDLGGLYPYRVLVEGNDPRLIDIGVLSKLPIGATGSFRHAVHPAVPNQPVFGRDLLEVEILTPTRSRRLFTLYNNHLKSRFIRYDEDPATAQTSNDTRRRHQAEVTAEIVEKRMRPNSSYIVLGDMNDAPGSAHVAPLVTAPGLGLVDGLAAPTEIRPPGLTINIPDDPRWTHRFKPTGQPAEYELFDQIWLSPALAPKQSGGFIHRRLNLTGYGSDHDPGWVELDL